MWRVWIAVVGIAVAATGVGANDAGVAWHPVPADVHGSPPVREAGGLRFTTRVAVVEHDGGYALNVRVDVKNVSKSPLPLACQLLSFAAAAGTMRGRRFESDGGIYGEGSPRGTTCEDGEPLAAGHSRTLERRIPDGTYAPVARGHAARLWLSANLASPRNLGLATMVLAISAAGDAQVTFEREDAR